MAPTQQNLNKFDIHLRKKTMIQNKKMAKQYDHDNVPKTSTGPKTTAFSVYSGFSSLSRGAIFTAHQN